jgi:hypothetical protein
VEDDGTGIFFVAVRRNMGRIAAEAGMLAVIAQGLRSLDRWEGRARLSGAYARCYMIYGVLPITKVK